jgi:hypothetical protein
MKDIVSYFFHPALLRREFANYWFLLIGLFLDIYPAIKTGYVSLLTWPFREILVAVAMVYVRHHIGRLLFKKIKPPLLVVTPGMDVFVLIIFLGTIWRTMVAFCQ